MKTNQRLAGDHVDDARAPQQFIRDLFAQRIRSKMDEKGWSQSELARQAGVGRDLISGYVNAKTLPTRDNAGKLAAALDLPPEMLMPVNASDDQRELPLSAIVTAQGAHVRFYAAVDLEHAFSLVQAVTNWVRQDGHLRDPELDKIALEVLPNQSEGKVRLDVLIHTERLLELMKLVPTALGDRIPAHPDISSGHGISKG